jgi:hypothetical protein
MTDQHRATAEQWREAKEHKYLFTCLLELRDRIEALEAAAKPNHSEIPDSSPLSQVSEAANRIRAAAHMRPNYPEKPDGSLVKRVAAAIHPNVCADPNLYLHEARAAIREVAAWLRDQKGYGHGWAIRLELEAEQ